MKTIPFGLWPGTIDEKSVAKRGRLNTLKWDPEGKLWFSGYSEGSPFLYSFHETEGLLKMNGDLAVGGSVGYGGGDFDTSHDGVIFAVRKSGLYLQTNSDRTNLRLTNDNLCSASPAIAQDGSKVAYVASDGENDQIALLNLRKRSWPELWIQGADFYMQPVWHPDGKYFAWVEWDHPLMSWQGSRVMLAELDSESRILKIHKIAGGAGIPASQPAFSADGIWLSYLIRDGNWENLNLLNLESRQEKTLIHGEDFSLSRPEFAQGEKTYDWHADSKQITFLKMFANRSEAVTVNIETGDRQAQTLAGLTVIHTLAVSNIGKLAVTGSGPFDSALAAVVENGSLRVIFRLNDASLDKKNISRGQELSWQAPDGSMVYGIYFPPCHEGYSWRGAPPAFVHIHGGPTGKAENGYNAEIQYFTSRGFGWLEVNYRGSTGYGWDYLEALDGNWGVYDVEDAIGSANCIGAMGLADRSRLMIIGGSAGGFTVLNALASYPKAFKCGACLYGVSDLLGLAIDTHKLELHYTDSLVGKLPEAIDLYKQRSPLYRSEKIIAPLLVFHGGQDEAVPLSQAENLVSRLAGPHEYRVYPEEGHGFRSPDTIKDYLKTLLEFAKKYLI